MILGLVPLTEISSKAIVKSKDRFSDASVVITTNQANGQYMFDFKANAKQLEEKSAQQAIRGQTYYCIKGEESKFGQNGWL